MCVLLWLIEKAHERARTAEQGHAHEHEYEHAAVEHVDENDLTEHAARNDERVQNRCALECRAAGDCGLRFIRRMRRAAQRRCVRYAETLSFSSSLLDRGVLVLVLVRVHLLGRACSLVRFFDERRSG